MAAQSLSLAQTVRRYAASRRRRVGALACVRAAWLAIAALLALVYIDVLVQLGPQARLYLLGIAALGLAGIAVITYRRHARAQSEQRLVARLLEQGDSNLGNDLINALEFEELLARDAPLTASKPLMRRGVSLASEKAAHVTHTEILAPPSLRRESRFVMLGMATLAVSAVVFAGVFQAVLPRYYDPYGDHPPFSPTKLILEPAGLIVDYGESATIRAIAEGIQPGDVTLVLEDENGVVTAELPMLRELDGAYSQVIEHVRAAYAYHARFNRGRSKRYALTTSKVPRIVDVSVRYDYPAYTGLPPKTRQIGDPALIRAYEGTTTTLIIASNRPLASSSLRVDGVEIPFAPGKDPQIAEGSFMIDRHGELEASLVDVDGNAGRDRFFALIDVQPDEEPVINIISPGRQAFAIPTAEIPIQIETSDDLGVSSVTLYRGLNQSGDSPKTILASEKGETQSALLERLDLKDLGVRPGDIIDLYATATDAHPGNPHTVATPSHQITIISEEQLQSFEQQETTADDLRQKYGELEAMVESLGKEQQEILAQTQALQNAPGGGADVQEKLAQLAERQSALSQQAEAAAKDLAREAESAAVFDIEKEFKKTLQETAASLQRAREHMNKSSEQLAGAPADDTSREQAMDAAAQHQEQALDELGQGQRAIAEDIQKPMDDIQKMYKLLEDVETFKAIYQAQTDLERQSRSYQDVRNPSLDQQVRLKELGEAQKEIRSALIDLRTSIEKHAEEIEETLPKVGRDARGIADGIDGRNIPTVMEQAMGDLSGGDGVNGHAKASEAKQLLEQMIQRVEQAQGASSETEARLQITMGLDAGNTMAQMRNSLKPGFTPSPSGMGGNGSESAMPFNVFGAEGEAGKPARESAMSSTRAEANAREADEALTVAGSLEEIATTQESDMNVDTGPAEPVIEEYRAVIDAYFERIADEK